MFTDELFIIIIVTGVFGPNMYVSLFRTGIFYRHIIYLYKTFLKVVATIFFTLIRFLKTIAL